MNPKLFSLLLVLVTVVSKLIGFVREVILLEAVGISSDLDTFLIIFGLSSLLSGLIGTCVVTTLAPAIMKIKSDDKILQFHHEGMRVGFYAFLIATAISLIYVWLILPDRDIAGDSVKLALVVPLTVIFAVLAEYQVAMFLSRKQQVPIIFGNILISVPVVVLMLFIQPDILTYSIWLASAFAFRCLIFAFFLLGKQARLPALLGVFRKQKLHSLAIQKIIFGGTAMLAVSLVNVTGLLVAQQMHEGAATLLGYGHKVPYLVLTSIWFVLGTNFFAQIIASGGEDSVRRMINLTKVNASIALVIGLLILLGDMFQARVALFFNGELPKIYVIFISSLPLIPIVVFIPLIEMGQRVLATLDSQTETFFIGISIIIFAFILMGVSYLIANVMILMLAMSASFGFGALLSFIVVKRKYRPAQND